MNRRTVSITLAALAIAGTLAMPVKAAEISPRQHIVAAERMRTYRCIPLNQGEQRSLLSACEDKGVPLEIALAVIEHESNFNRSSEYVNCIGLMGVTKEYNYLYGDLYTADNLADPRQNLKAGVYLLAHLYSLYGRWDAALTAYAIGERAAENYVFPYGTDSDYSDAILAGAAAWAIRLGI